MSDEKAEEKVSLPRSPIHFHFLCPKVVYKKSIRAAAAEIVKWL